MRFVLQSIRAPGPSDPLPARVGAARRPLGAVRVPPDQPGRRRAGGRPAHRPDPGQRLGHLPELRRRGVLGVRPRHRDQPAVLGRRERQRRSSRPFGVALPGGAPTGQVFNGTGEFVVTAGAASAAPPFIFAGETGFITGWSPAVPAAGVADRSGRRQPARDSRVHRPGDRQQRHRQLPLRRRLQERADRRVRQELRPGDPAGQLHRPGHAGQVRPVQHPEPRRPAVRHLRQAGPRAATWPTAATGSSASSTSTATSSSGWCPTTTSSRRGGWRWPRRASASSAARCWSATTATGGSTPTTRPPASTSAGCGTSTAGRSASTACSGWRSATAARPATPTPCTSRPGRTTARMACSGRCGSCPTPRMAKASPRRACLPRRRSGTVFPTIVGPIQVDRGPCRRGRGPDPAARTDLAVLRRGPDRSDGLDRPDCST